MNTSAPATRLQGLIAAAILGALGASFSAVCAADGSSADITVKFADLNITTPSGAARLYARIEVAAHAACAYFWFKTDANEARCLRNTIANAVTKVDQPRVTAVYNAKFKTSAPAAPLLSQSR